MVMAKHNITSADQLYYGGGYDPSLFGTNQRRGVPGGDQRAGGGGEAAGQRRDLPREDQGAGTGRQGDRQPRGLPGQDQGASHRGQAGPNRQGGILPGEGERPAGGNQGGRDGRGAERGAGAIGAADNASRCQRRCRREAGDLRGAGSADVGIHPGKLQSAAVVH